MKKQFKDWSTQELKDWKKDLREQEKYSYPSPKDVHNAIGIEIELYNRKQNETIQHNNERAFN